MQRVVVGTTPGPTELTKVRQPPPIPRPNVTSPLAGTKPVGEIGGRSHLGLFLGHELQQNQGCAHERDWRPVRGRPSDRKGREDPLDQPHVVVRRQPQEPPAVARRATPRRELLWSSRNKTEIRGADRCGQSLSEMRLSYWQDVGGHGDEKRSNVRKPDDIPSNVRKPSAAGGEKEV